MRQLMMVCAIALSVFAFGCKKGGSASEAAGKMEGFAKAMCDCKDKTCGDKVNDDMKKWGEEMAKSAGKDTDTKPDPDLAKRMGDATTKLSECYTKLATPAATTPDTPKADDKKPDDKKPEETKADDKKPEETKAGDKKPDDKKADDKKPDDKKSGGW
jgi:hypothetical protein